MGEGALSALFLGINELKSRVRAANGRVARAKSTSVLQLQDWKILEKENKRTFFFSPSGYKYSSV